MIITFCALNVVLTTKEFLTSHIHLQVGLLGFLKYVTPIHDNEIPPTSLLREFLVPHALP